MLYALHLYNDVCQLFLNETGKNIKQCSTWLNYTGKSFVVYLRIEKKMDSTELLRL